MTEWTSISVTEEQKQTLKDAKPDGVAMGKFLVESLDGDTTDTDTDTMQVVPVEEVVGRDVPQSNLEQDTDALRHQLERNYEAIKEATNAAEGAKRTVENLR